MSEAYKGVETQELQRMWERERDRLLKMKDATVGDYSALFAMRRELDRRSGETRPVVEVNFEKYITD